MGRIKLAVSCLSTGLLMVGGCKSNDGGSRLRAIEPVQADGASPALVDDPAAPGVSSAPPGYRFRAYCQGSAGHANGLIAQHQFTFSGLGLPGAEKAPAVSPGSNARLSDELVSVTPPKRTGGVSSDFAFTCVPGSLAPETAEVADRLGAAAAEIVAVCGPTPSSLRPETTGYRVALYRRTEPADAAASVTLAVYRDPAAGGKVLLSAPCAIFAPAN